MHLDVKLLLVTHYVNCHCMHIESRQTQYCLCKSKRFFLCVAIAISFLSMWWRQMIILANILSKSLWPGTLRIRHAFSFSFTHSLVYTWKWEHFRWMSKSLTWWNFRTFAIAISYSWLVLFQLFSSVCLNSISSHIQIDRFNSRLTRFKYESLESNTW